MNRWHISYGMVVCLALLSWIGSTAQADSNATAVFLPETLEIGMASSPSDGAAASASAGIKYRYQYLSAGVNTGYGWSTWNSNGDFARYYIQDSVNHDVIPVLTYYNILQSSPGSGSSEQQRVTNNLANLSTMTAYWNDVALFFEKAALFPDETVIFHVEPDMWGFMHVQSPNNNAAQYPYTVHVGSTGIAALSGLPNTPSGFAQALFALRASEGATNVQIAYHHSRWGTDSDFTYGNPSNAEILGWADEAATFYNSLNQEFDLTFDGVRDRDAGYYQHVLNNSATWWDSTDFSNQAAYIARFKEQTGQNVMLWQVPFGNMSLNNTTGRYQDNIVATFLGESDYETLKMYRDAGLVGILFGAGHANATQVENDGGYFYSQLTRYNNAGALITAPQVTTVASYSGSDGQNASFSWTTNIDNVTSYEVWSGTTADFTPGTNCGASSNCVSNGTSTTYTAPTPALNEIVYYKIVAVHPDGRTVSNLALAFYLTNHVYLPVIVR